MAVTITQEQLRAALRLGDTPDEQAQVARLHPYAVEAVNKHAPNAPAAVANEAVVRIAGYLFDQPPAPSGSTYANALRNSGAGSILLPYRNHRAGKVAT